MRSARLTPSYANAGAGGSRSSFPKPNQNAIACGTLCDRFYPGEPATNDMME
ncbi:MAG TPA: hypothetical protein V6D30_08045 [Leptolyngbyaceae cyanobacterium]